MVTRPPGLEAGDPAWRAWLETTGQKTFRFDSPAGTFSGRRESKAARDYWYAYRKIAGRLRKAYLGRCEDLTRERLEAVAAQLAGRIEPPRPAEPDPFDDLPKPPTPLIGRQQDIVLLVQRILRPEVRLLTLTGPGGTGKTRLAIAVAEQVAARFADGARFIDLSPLIDADLVVREIARHLQIQDVSEVPVRERLHHHLAARKALLVLDNMEQVLVAAPELVALLEACPGVRLLVTSREPLHVELEVLHAVAPLGVPNLDVPLALADLQQVPAVDLFVARAREAGAALELDEPIGRDVAELCVRLDVLPLAIELAAARARLLRPRDMLARIARQIELLRTGDDRGARHQSLRAAVGWSYDLLSEAEQRAFRCLSVFAGGCSLDAAEAVLDQPGTLDLLASLLDKSLVRNEPGQAGKSRLRQLETIRAFGLEQLAESGESDMVRARHAAYYLALARPESWDALDLPAADWLELIAPEHDNLRAALGWSFDHDQRRLGLELATALQGFWMVSGYLREGLSWIEQAISHSEGVHPEVEAWAHHAAGQLAWRQGEYDRAAQHYAAGMALRQARGDTFGVAIARQGLASVARDRGDVREAIVLWEQCVAAFRQYQHQARTARASLNLAIALHLDGQSERAVTLLEESARVAGDIGQHWAQATSLTYLALIALEVHRDRSRAAGHVRAALPLVPRVSDAWVTTHLLELAAWLAAGSDQSAPMAARLFGAAEALRERIGARLHPAFAVGRERWLNGLWQREDLDLPLAEGAAASLDDMLRLAMKVARDLAHRPTQAADAVRDLRVLSVRERHIAGLVAQGMTSRRIAELLILGERTVETHVDHIRAKLGVRSRAQIAAWAVEHGLAAREAPVGERDG